MLVRKLINHHNFIAVFLVPLTKSKDCTVTISTTEEFPNAVDIAKPGNVICVESGIYTKGSGSSVIKISTKGSSND